MSRVPSPDNAILELQRLRKRLEVLERGSRRVGPLRLKVYTTSERDALTSVADGMVIYNSTAAQVQARVSGAWVAL